MKKHLLFVIVIIFAVVGCKIDESGLPQIQTNALLIGTWYIKALTTITPAMGNYPQIDYTATDFTKNDFYQFNKDNTLIYSMANPDTVVNGRYSYVNNSSGEKIVLPEPGGEGTSYIIKKLTADSLVFTSTISLSVNSGTPVIYPVIYRLAHK